MPSKPIDRLMFAQGGQCFFCRQALPRSEASVEHLVALTHGGHDNDENCVACCKGLNTLFGRMSLKEKLQIVLNQKGELRCPMQASTCATSLEATEPAHAPSRTRADVLALIVTDLQKRAGSKPATRDKLLSTIKSLLERAGEPGDDADSLLAALIAKGYVHITGNKLTYTLPGALRRV